MRISTQMPPSPSLRWPGSIFIPGADVALQRNQLSFSAAMWAWFFNRRFHVGTEFWRFPVCFRRYAFLSTIFWRFPGCLNYCAYLRSNFFAKWLASLRSIYVIITVVTSAAQRQEVHETVCPVNTVDCRQVPRLPFTAHHTLMLGCLTAFFDYAAILGLITKTGPYLFPTSVPDLIFNKRFTY